MLVLNFAQEYVCYNEFKSFCQIFCGEGGRTIGDILADWQENGRKTPLHHIFYSIL